MLFFIRPFPNVKVFKTIRPYSNFPKLFLYDNKYYLIINMNKQLYDKESTFHTY
ncbi:hypothetical protein Asal01_02350 [Fodinibius salicampi]